MCLKWTIKKSNPYVKCVMIMYSDVCCTFFLILCSLLHYYICCIISPLKKFCHFAFCFVFFRSPKYHNLVPTFPRSAVHSTAGCTFDVILMSLVQ